MQSLNNYKSLGLFNVLRLIFGFVTLCDTESIIHRGGVRIKYSRVTARQKQSARAKPSTYKAPESAKRLLSGAVVSAKDTYKNITSDRMENQSIEDEPHGNRQPAIESIDKNAPVQLVNRRFCCYANTVLQNVRSCPPLQSTILSDTNLDHGTNHQQEQLRSFNLFATMLRQLEEHTQNHGHNNTTYSTVFPIELIECITRYDNSFQEDSGIRSDTMLTLHRDPLDFFTWVVRCLLESGNEGHPLLSEVCTMGRQTMAYWCDNCHSGSGDNIVNKHRDIGMYHLSVNHTYGGCTIKDCLDEYFSTMDSEVSFSSETYFHECANPYPKQNIRLMNLFGHMEKVLIIQLNPRLYKFSNEPDQTDMHEVQEADIARVVLEIDLTNFVDLDNDCDENKKIVARLNGFISRMAYPDSDNGVTGGHFISVTKNSRTGEFYCSDDLQPQSPQNIGIEPTSKWPRPYILFYSVSSTQLQPWSEISLLD